MLGTPWCCRLCGRPDVTPLAAASLFVLLAAALLAAAFSIAR